MDKVKHYAWDFALGFARPFDFYGTIEDDTDNIGAFLYGMGKGISYGVMIHGVLFLVAAKAGAVVPVKWKHLWSSWFWEMNH